MPGRVREVKRTNGDDDIGHHAKHSLEVVGLAIPQERSND
jgi:hypothetical protein